TIILASIAFRIYYRNDGITLFFNSFCIMSDFAVGAWLAMLAINQNDFFIWLKKIPRAAVAFTYVILISCIIFYHPVFDSSVATILERLILGIGFGFVILDQVFGENRIFNLHKIPGIVWLGKRAYGFYVFHQAGILIAIKILTALHFIQSPFQFVVLMPLLAFAITIAMAALSYRFFEKYFLNWKGKFEV
ncbi:MAG: hypothetical protein LH473_06045, partial [Chitinophagales bacterium]|nr:hypothetical protein [Chitinophagales bacterium]